MSMGLLALCVRRLSLRAVLERGLHIRRLAVRWFVNKMSSHLPHVHAANLPRKACCIDFCPSSIQMETIAEVVPRKFAGR